jgi:hypothetical protein
LITLTERKALGFPAVDDKEIPIVMSELKALTFNEKTKYILKETIFSADVHVMATEELIQYVMDFEKTQVSMDI